MQSTAKAAKITQINVALYPSNVSFRIASLSSKKGPLLPGRVLLIKPQHHVINQQNQGISSIQVFQRVRNRLVSFPLLLSHSIFFYPASTPLPRVYLPPPPIFRSLLYLIPSSVPTLTMRRT